MTRKISPSDKESERQKVFSHGGGYQSRKGIRAGSKSRKGVTWGAGISLEAKKDFTGGEEEREFP